ncbi:hypothetical protein DPMN_136277 [Dreissena polymorpha]|uniref:Uncharacterized protein n=1 Tax=Dreissena polymorpha TaxID=45954 RepID=A0A9D4G2G0_DREPO|nr:hypothetical protein DPMN_136277 [Dreissena polymorpha]
MATISLLSKSFLDTATDKIDTDIETYSVSKPISASLMISVYTHYGPRFDHQTTSDVLDGISALGDLMLNTKKKGMKLSLFVIHNVTVFKSLFRINITNLITSMFYSREDPRGIRDNSREDSRGRMALMLNCREDAFQLKSREDCRKDDTVSLYQSIKIPDSSGANDHSFALHNGSFEFITRREREEREKRERERERREKRREREEAEERERERERERRGERASREIERERLASADTSLLDLCSRSFARSRYRAKISLSL